MKWIAQQELMNEGATSIQIHCMHSVLRKCKIGKVNIKTYNMMAKQLQVSIH